MIPFRSTHIEFRHLTWHTSRVYSVSQSIGQRTVLLEPINAPRLGRFTTVTIENKVGFVNYFYIAKNHQTTQWFSPGLRCYSDSTTYKNFWNKPCDLINYTTITENSINSNITLSPNPTQNILNIESGELEILNYEIFDIQGKEISIELNSTSQINVSNFKQGIYILKIHTKTGIAIKKWVKE